jgi:hypothetical protein
MRLVVGKASLDACSSRGERGEAAPLSGVSDGAMWGLARQANVAALTRGSPSEARVPSVFNA